MSTCLFFPCQNYINGAKITSSCIDRAVKHHVNKLENYIECKFLMAKQAFSKESVPEKYFFHFSPKTYVVGTQKNRLNETVLLSTQNIC